ncbi:MAG: nucleotidyltransferase domain-containing protein [Desulfomonilaceae bacterium]
MFKWPDRGKVDRVVREWAATMVRSRSGIIRLGYFGSYARGDWGVGSDLDLVAIVDHTTEPFERRSLTWGLSPLPVPAELLVYTSTEWQSLQNKGGRFARTLEEETVWVYEAPDTASVQ